MGNYPVRFDMRMNPEDLDHLDRVRGDLSRSEWLRQAIRAAKPHRHTRDHVVRTEYARGSTVDVWACTCGKEMR